jgi:hypothetical protein
VIEAKLVGIEEFRAKVLGRLKTEGRVQIRAANEANADEFVNQVSSSISHTTERRTDADHVPLEQTLVKEPLGEVGFKVSIGGENAPHPLHLDAGHMTPDGKHVPAFPFWAISRRFLASRRKSRLARAQNAAVKAATS